MPATYKPLVNGEEAFAAVYHAIMNAQKTVDIICWGFQPSMYFIRDGQSLCIGELLCKIAETKKVQVRILGWEMPCNAAGGGGEANLPGKGVIRYKDRKGQSTTDERYAYDRQWFRQTGQDLLTIRDSVSIAKKLKLRAVHGTPVMAQLLRTQAQAGKHDIETLYLQAVNNATQFIYIENQYFRWPPLAELINQVAERQSKVGRELHLFVVTNVTDEGIGAGTVNTQRMLEVLGRANIIPEVTKLRKIGQLSNAMFGGSVGYIDPGDTNKRNREMSEKIADFKKKADEIQSSEILPEERPGLKVHICSLVAPDSPPEEWMPVYIHSKLMIVNDVFTTHGSANINTRSMQVDSEMNIAHEWASVTRDLRRRLWNMHTNGRGGQDEAKDAFKAWGYLINTNEKLQGTGKDRPEAPLIKFLYNKSTLSDLD
ncbi:phospholipase D-like domain-containing protein [Klebsiella variicola]|uniref:phospholipase D-like domain-containing protein n=1 Tax=Klebsiella variicola TaxID=244366 RepID=UPI001D12C2DF|nr:phospholipase D-like domain-containing protein [Klebsiella variicola]